LRHNEPDGQTAIFAPHRLGSAESDWLELAGMGEKFINAAPEKALWKAGRMATSIDHRRFSAS